ncbi:MAG: flagellar biosynthetic protein FliR [Planctomycetes bacterium]|nr:flagellar biosynthetic protein FliR [Planctomycetota bacterium]
MWLRLSGFFMAVPFFGSELAPVYVRALLSFGIAAVLFPVLGETMPDFPANQGLFLYACGTELLIGIIFGLAVQTIFIAVQLAGSHASMTIGISLANVIDPISNLNVSIIAQLKFFLAFFVFLGLNGHLILLKLMVMSYRVLPVLTFVQRFEATIPSRSGMFPDLAMEYLIVDIFGQFWIFGLLLVAPVEVTVFLVTISMGFMARAAPEMNVFILGFAARIIVGFLFLGLTLESFVKVLTILIDKVVTGNSSMLLMLLKIFATNPAGM